MLDKIYYKNNKEVVLIFTDRPPFGLYHSGGKILEFLDEFLAPIGSGCVNLTEYRHRLRVGEEDTLVIHIDDVA